MQIIIDYFTFVVNKIINILNTFKFPGSSSFLYYFLGAIIIGFIIKLVKGGSSEFEHSFNFDNNFVFSKGFSNYKQKHDERKQQVVKESEK